MNLICLSDNDRVIDGLDAMMTAAGELGGFGSRYVEVPKALLIVAVATWAENRPDWFPAGQWATIQAISNRIDQELDGLFERNPNPNPVGD